MKTLAGFRIEEKDADTTEFHRSGLRLAAACREYEDGTASYYTIDAVTGEHDSDHETLDCAMQAALRS